MQTAIDPQSYRLAVPASRLQHMDPNYNSNSNSASDLYRSRNVSSTPEKTNDKYQTGLRETPPHPYSARAPTQYASPRRYEEQSIQNERIGEHMSGSRVAPAPIARREGELRRHSLDEAASAAARGGDGVPSLRNGIETASSGGGRSSNSCRNDDRNNNRGDGGGGGDCSALDDALRYGCLLRPQHRQHSPARTHMGEMKTPTGQPHVLHPVSRNMPAPLAASSSPVRTARASGPLRSSSSLPSSSPLSEKYFSVFQHVGNGCHYRGETTEAEASANGVYRGSHNQGSRRINDSGNGGSGDSGANLVDSRIFSHRDHHQPYAQAVKSAAFCDRAPRGAVGVTTAATTTHAQTGAGRTAADPSELPQHVYYEDYFMYQNDSPPPPKKMSTVNARDVAAGTVAASSPLSMHQEQNQEEQQQGRRQWRRERPQERRHYAQHYHDGRSAGDVRTAYVDPHRDDMAEAVPVRCDPIRSQHRIEEAGHYRAHGLHQPPVQQQQSSVAKPARTQVGGGGGDGGKARGEYHPHHNTHYNGLVRLLHNGNSAVGLRDAHACHGRGHDLLRGGASNHAGASPRDVAVYRRAVAGVIGVDPALLLERDRIGVPGGACGYRRVTREEEVKEKRKEAIQAEGQRRRLATSAAHTVTENAASATTRAAKTGSTDGITASSPRPGGAASPRSSPSLAVPSYAAVGTRMRLPEAAVMSHFDGGVYNNVSAEGGGRRARQERLALHRATHEYDGGGSGDDNVYRYNSINNYAGGGAILQCFDRGTRGERLPRKVNEIAWEEVSPRSADAVADKDSDHDKDGRARHLPSSSPTAPPERATRRHSHSVLLESQHNTREVTPRRPRRADVHPVILGGGAAAMEVLLQRARRSTDRQTSLGGDVGNDYDDGYDENDTEIDHAKDNAPTTASSFSHENMRTRDVLPQQVPLQMTSAVRLLSLRGCGGVDVNCSPSAFPPSRYRLTQQQQRATNAGADTTNAATGAALALTAASFSPTALDDSGRSRGGALLPSPQDHDCRGNQGGQQRQRHQQQKQQQDDGNQAQQQDEEVLRAHEEERRRLLLWEPLLSPLLLEVEERLRRTPTVALTRVLSQQTEQVKRRRRRVVLLRRYGSRHALTREGTLPCGAQGSAHGGGTGSTSDEKQQRHRCRRETACERTVGATADGDWGRRGADSSSGVCGDTHRDDNPSDEGEGAPLLAVDAAVMARIVAAPVLSLHSLWRAPRGIVAAALVAAGFQNARDRETVLQELERALRTSSARYALNI